MLHKKICIPKEYSYEIMAKLGSIYSSIEFEDLNKNVLETHKSHSSIINRCDEIETMFTHIDEILVNHLNIKYDLYNNYEDFKTHLDYEIKKTNINEKIQEKNYFDIIQNMIAEDETKIKIQYNSNKEQIDLFNKLLERKYVFEKMVELFEIEIIKEPEKFGLNNDYYEFDNDEEINLINKKQNKDWNIFEPPIKYLCGMCETEDAMKLSRLIFRLGRGLGVISFYYPKINKNDNIFNDGKKYFESKQIFLVVISGEHAFERIKDILSRLGYDIYRIVNASKAKKKLQEINKELLEQKELIKKLKRAFNDMIKPRVEKVKIGDKTYKSLYSLYRTFCKREKYIYQNLNKCKDINSIYIGDVWIPKIEFDTLNLRLRELLNEKDDMALPVFQKSDNLDSKVRTYFPMDDFVYPFQSIVDTYGIARYKEANPGLFTIITFPFLFGIMFGDIGHGFLLICLSFYIIFNKEKIYYSESILKELLKFRYILLLMGVFSFFCGLVYNDFMSIPLSIFNSCYTNSKDKTVAIREKNCIYPFGFDPKWYASTNELTFMNSFKMKLSVIVGVTQMTLGIILRGLNNLYVKDYIGFIFEFIPQILFMLLLFGYMIALIFIKWSTDYTGNTENAPSIITILMNLALKNGSVDGKPVWSSVEIEEMTNKIFVYISIICIPVMLLIKPIVKILEQHKKRREIENNEIKEENKENNDKFLKIIDETEPLLEKDILRDAEISYDSERSSFLEQFMLQGNEKEQSPTDIFVHQIIETIEFVLGCISNTASYLRLWALSLAHSQLSKVFFEKSLLALANVNFILVIIGYFIFANITISVLMGMDLLEAFLHTLRLHWVEFQNKFYYADGNEFIPFSFDYLLDNDK